MIYRSNVIGFSKVDEFNSSVTIYVSPTGNDTTGYGTESRPFLTIDRAAKEAARYSSVQRVTIALMSGTYTGTVSFRSLCKRLTVRSDTNNADDVIVDGTLSFTKGGQEIAVENITVHNNSMTISSCYEASINGIKFTGTSAYGIDGDATYLLVQNCEFNNRTIYAIGCSRFMRCRNNSGSGNAIVHRCYGILLRSGTVPSGSTLDSKLDGGQIFIG